MEQQASEPVVGAPLMGSRGERIGRIEAAFADYLLVRTVGVMPVDLYVPRPEVSSGPSARSFSVDCGRREAYRRWHRPLRRAPHD